MRWFAETYIDNARVRSADTVRWSWTMSPSADETRAWPDAEVAYAHLDRFVLFARARCGEHVLGTERGVPLPPGSPRS